MLYTVDIIFILITLGLCYYVFFGANKSTGKQLGFSFVMTLILCLFWLLVNAVSSFRTEAIRVPPSSYEVFKTNSEVIFKGDNFQRTRDEHYIYENAEDTTRVYFVREKSWNRFGAVFSTHVELKTDRSE